jgi:hypothetical protein
MAYGMNSNAPQQLIASGYTQFAAVCTAYLIIITAAGSITLSRKDM